MAEETKTCTTCGRRFSDDAIFCPKDGTALVASAAARGKDPFVGREILGHIEIRSLIGAGAMGRVYRAYQKGIDRDVAVKILHKDLASNPDLVARFLREAKVASRLQHPNVVNVLLAGQLEDGTMYLVMEYLDGISLQSALLAAGGALPLPRALHVALQICDAVGEAHGAGVVHRDVKPENVMLVKRGDDLDFVKVLDFGIARLGGKEPGQSGIETQAGLVFGTARYLSPEGARGEPVGPTSDVYAIATVVYQMIAGRTPFEHDSSVSLLVAQIHDPAPMLRSVPRATYVPAQIEHAIMRNLSKDPTTRDADGHVFGRALLEAATSAGFAAEDLLVRSAVARTRRPPTPSAMNLPSSEKTREQPFGFGPSSRISADSAPQHHAQQHGAQQHGSTPTPVKLAAVADNASSNNIYHPSYSGRPIENAPQAPQPGERRVARTLDDEGGAPSASHEAVSVARPGTPPQLGVDGGATVGMAPLGTPPELRQAGPAGPPARSSDESILGTASTPRGDEMQPAGVPRPRGRIFAAIFVFALLAMAGIGIGAYRLGYFGKKPVSTKQAEVEELLTRARSALEAGHWDTPPGDNVLDLTDKLINLAPGETRTYQIRNAAADRIVREALDRKSNKDLPGALKLYQLALRLSPASKGVQDEIEEVEAELAKDPSTASLVTDGGAARFTASLKIGSDDAPLKMLEPVTLTATLAGEAVKTPDPKAHFSIQGPGLDKPKQIDARVEGSNKYVASFVFPQSGTFKIHFFARPDAFPVKAETEKTIGGGAGVPPKPTTTGTWPTAKPTTSSKPLSTGPTGPSPTGTITLTPDPVPFPVPTATTTAPPPPFPTLP